MVPEGSLNMAPLSMVEDGQGCAEDDAGGSDREHQALMRGSKETGAPGICAEQKQADGARDRCKMCMGKIETAFRVAQGRHVGISAAWHRCGALLRHRVQCDGRGNSPGGGNDCINRYSARNASAPHAGSERGPHSNGSTINPASAYSMRMSPCQIRHRDETDRQQHRQPAHQKLRASRACRKPLELNGKANPEQQREQRERLQVDAEHQDRFDGAVDRRSTGFGDQELFEDGNAESHHEVDGENAEEGNAAQRVDGIDASRRVYRRGVTYCRVNVARSGSDEAIQSLSLRSHGLLRFARNDGERNSQPYDSRISSSRRPSVLSSFFTALEAAISPWLA